MRCLKCKAEAIVKNGFVKGIQRYKCKVCFCQFTKEIPHGKSSKLSTQAIILYLSGLSLRAIGRFLGVSGQSIGRWIRAFYLKNKDDMVPIGTFEEIEIDEMHHFLCKKNNNFGYGKLYATKLENLLGGYAVIVVPKL